MEKNDERLTTLRGIGGELRGLTARVSTMTSELAELGADVGRRVDGWLGAFDERFRRIELRLANTEVAVTTELVVANSSLRDILRALEAKGRAAGPESVMDRLERRVAALEGRGCDPSRCAVGPEAAGR